MALLPIVTVPDKRLKTKSTPVTVVDEELRKLMDDMLETMYAAPGIGLSAIQVDVPKRLVVVDVGKENEDSSENGRVKNPYFFVNPEILDTSDELSNYDEGCLSLPEQYAEVVRPEHVKIGYVDYQGEEQVIEASGLFSRCIQHEIDHLDGILFVDHISTLKRNMIVRRLTKLKRQNAED